MKIAIFCNKPLPSERITGSGQIYYTAEELAKLGHEVAFVVKSNEIPGLFAVENHNRIPSMKIVKLRFFAKTSPLVAFMLAVLWKADVFYDFKWLGFGKLLKGLFGIGITMPLNMEFLKKPGLLNYVDCTLCISKYIGGKFRGIKLKNNVVVYCGADTEKFEAEGKAKKHSILTIANITDREGILLLAEAMPEIVKRFPDARWIQVGPKIGEEAGYFEKVMETLRSNNCLKYVKFLGYQPHEKLPKFINSSEIFVFPSLDEDFGIVLAEAMACEKAIVANDIPTVREIFGKKRCGLIFKRNSSKDLARKVILLLKNKKLQKQLGKNARKRVLEEFTWKHTALNALEGFERIRGMG